MGRTDGWKNYNKSRTLLLVCPSSVYSRGLLRCTLSCPSFPFSFPGQECDRRTACFGSSSAGHVQGSMVWWSSRARCRRLPYPDAIARTLPQQRRSVGCPDLQQRHDATVLIDRFSVKHKSRSRNELHMPKAFCRCKRRITVVENANRIGYGLYTSICNFTCSKRV